MRTAPSRKDISHERIVAVAARAIRRGGFQGMGVADIMKEAGLTHGGFYAHFRNRDALLAEALERAGQDSAVRLHDGVARREARGSSPLRALVEAYLSERHLGEIEAGCARRRQSVCGAWSPACDGRCPRRRRRRVPLRWPARWWVRCNWRAPWVTTPRAARCSSRRANRCWRCTIGRPVAERTP